MRPDEVTFTASGTDAVHRGLLGLSPAGAGTATARRALRRRALRRPARRRLGGRRDGAPPASVPVDRLGPGLRRRRRRGGRAGPASRSRPCRPPTTRSAPCSRWREVAGGRRGGRPAVRRRLRLDGPAAAARRLGRRWPARRTSGAARPASACCSCASGARWRDPVPRRRPGRRARHRLRERPGRPRRRGGAAGRGRRARRGRRAPARPRRPGPGRGRPGSRTSRWSATRSTGSPTW